MTDIRFTSPPTLSKPRGYSHVAEVRAGRTVYVAGQVAFDAGGNLVGKGDFEAQAVQVFENLKAALAAVGASFEHVVKINVYFRDIADLAALRPIRDRYVNTDAPPTSTAVGVTGLAHPDLLLEIEAVAVIPE